MKTYELMLPNGRIVHQQAGDSFEACCIAAARLGVKVTAFRSFRWVHNEQEAQR